ncbi:hypothetical protein [Macrococcus armenti]|uniref:hypothetical protein n=1 Tax=Macrococcus armenti TaxID=2875764 RepID=UPI001CCC14CF|nr:hypothetical protein [Macrococcus armenti]UBH09795.1 hypothetical protein LAU41_11760 [Macrococcus armenti]
MKIINLNEELFSENKLNQKEILNNKEGNRPYYYSFKRNDYFVCIPMRSNAKSVPLKYKLDLGDIQPNKPYSAVDTTKSIILSKEQYLESKSKAYINKETHTFIKDNTEFIEKKFDNLVNDYINIKARSLDIPLIQYTSIQYFHNELDLDNIIDTKKINLAIDEIIENGKTNKFKAIKQSIISDSPILDKYEMLSTFGEYYERYTNNGYSINADNLNNPKIVLNIDKTTNESINIDDLTDNIDYYAEKYLSDVTHNNDHSIDI